MQSRVTEAHRINKLNQRFGTFVSKTNFCSAYSNNIHEIQQLQINNCYALLMINIR